MSEALDTPLASRDWRLGNWTAKSFGLAILLAALTGSAQPVASFGALGGELAVTRSDRLPASADVEILRREGGVLLVRRHRAVD